MARRRFVYRGSYIARVWYRDSLYQTLGLTGRWPAPAGTVTARLRPRKATETAATSPSRRARVPRLRRSTTEHSVVAWSDGLRSAGMRAERPGIAA
jgi:hypothetical protein